MPHDVEEFLNVPMSDTVASTKHAVFEGADAALDAFAGYIVPLGAGFAGYLSAASLGGMDAIYNILGGANAVGWYQNRVGPIVMALVWGGVGTIFWRLGSRGGIPMRLLGRGVGGYFYGAAVGCGIYALNPKAISPGFLDTFADKIEQETQ